MKRVIFGLIAVLTVFAMISCDNGTTTPAKVKVTFDQDYTGKPTPTVKEVEKGKSLGTAFPAAPTRTDYTFGGWFTGRSGAGTAFTKDTKVNADITVYAKWTEGTTPGPGPQPGEGVFELGDFTIENNDNQKGWATNGVDDVETDLEWETIVGAKYLVLITKGSSNLNGFGGLQIAFQGDGNNWAWKDPSVWGDWISFAHTADDVVVIVVDLATALGDDWATFLTGTKGKFFVCSYPLSGLGLQQAMLVTEAGAEGQIPEDATPIPGGKGYIFIAESEEPGPGPGPIPEEPIDLENEKYQGAELVTLANANQAIYYFALPKGAKWGDFNKLQTSYLVPQDATFDRENSGRAQRVYGNYDASFFQFNTTTAGNKYAYASLDSNTPGLDGTNNNNGYIISDTGKGGWKTLGTALTDYFGECPEKDTWFKIEYDLSGNASNQKPHPHMPYFGYNGPIILGLGLPGAGTPNKIFVKEVTLVHKTDSTKNVKGKALYIKKGDYEYPAFSAYGTADGNNVDDLARQIVGEDADGAMQSITIAAAEYQDILVGSERVSLSNAAQVLYKFVLPTGKTLADYKGLDASYLVPDEKLFDVSNSGRAQRVYGFYDIDCFVINETTAGNKYAYASLDGNLNNNGHILDDTGKGGWKSLSSALTDLLGTCPEAYEWFTINYQIDGSRANQKPHKYLPASTATGPFYLGLGLPGAGNVNTINMKDVTLVGKVAADNVVGTPLYITKDGVDYPAFCGYGTDGTAQENELGRGKWDGAVNITANKGTAYVAPQEITVTFDLNGEETNGTAVTTTLKLKKNDSFLIRDSLPTTSTTTAGKTFKGWATTSDGTTAVTNGDGDGGKGAAFSASASTVITAKLYAIWDSAPPPPPDPDPDAAEGTPIAITITSATDFTFTGNATAVDITDGYTITYDAVTSNSNYGSPNAWFKINWTALSLTDLSTIKAIEFDFTPVGGDVATKNINIVASATAHGYANDSVYDDEKVNNNTVSSGTPVASTAVHVKLLLPQAKLSTFTANTYYSIRIHAAEKGAFGGADTPTSYSITNIKLIPFAPVGP